MSEANCAGPSGSAFPWMMRPLDEWSICGMNHYHLSGQKRLFVSMTKDGRCITEEGTDDQYLWNRLWRKATSEPNDKLNSETA